MTGKVMNFLTLHKMKTKRILTCAILFCLVSVMTSGQDTNQSSTLVNKTNLVISMFDNDFVNKDAQNKITFNEGYHTAELRLIAMSGMLYRNLISSYTVEFTAEKNKTYLLDFVQCNYLDTIDNCYYFKRQYIQVLEKETKKVVGGICNSKVITTDLDPLRKNHLYGGEILPKENLTHVIINYYKFESFSLKGRSFDGLNLNYVYLPSASDVYTQKKEDLYLKPGYYRIQGFVKQSADFSIGNHATFKAPENRTIFVSAVTNVIGGSPVTSGDSLVSLSESSLNDVCFLPDGLHGWIVGNGGVILRTANGGKTWTYKGLRLFIDDPEYRTVYKKQTPTDLNKVHFIDSLNGWIAGEDGIIFHTTDGGINWSYQNCGNKLTLNALYFKNAKDGFAATYLESKTTWSLLCTHDGGNTWINLDKSIHPTKYHLGDSDGFWKIRADELHQSLDYGLTWEVSLKSKVKSGLWTDALNYTISDIYFLDNKNGWILMRDSVMYTRNGGENWEANVSPLVNMKAICFTDINTGYTAGNEGRLFLTSDGGRTWKKLISGTAENLNDIEFIDNNGWIVGALGGILTTNDGGKNWKYLNLLEFTQN